MGRLKQMLINMDHIKCTECNGDGDLEKVTWHPQGFDRDIGYESSTIVVCNECDGEGFIEVPKPEKTGLEKALDALCRSTHPPRV